MMKLTFAALVAALAMTTVADAAAILKRGAVPPPAIFVPNTPNTPGVESTTQDCTIEMGHLRLIRPAQIEAVGAYDGIFVQPVCENDEAGAIRNAGNAGGLRPTLATKADVVEALAELDYVADEVVGVRFGGGNTLVLYVHHD
jgi:hypothetical protein